jgi:ABC-type phosphate transport system auxiliary subunit
MNLHTFLNGSLEDYLNKVQKENPENNELIEIIKTAIQQQSALQEQIEKYKESINLKKSQLEAKERALKLEKQQREQEREAHRNAKLLVEVERDKLKKRYNEVMEKVNSLPPEYAGRFYGREGAPFYEGNLNDEYGPFLNIVLSPPQQIII